MKKVLVFDVETIYEHYDESEEVQVCVKRTKTFEADAYQQAWDYYEKRKKAFDILYTMDEGYYSEHEVNGHKYRGEETQFAMPGDGWMVLKLDVRVMNF